MRYLVILIALIGLAIGAERAAVAQWGSMLLISKRGAEGNTTLPCDSGPNAMIPAPAQTAAFTKCAVNADFTSLSGTYSNTANFIDACGASNAGVSGWVWVLYYWGVSGTPAQSCSNAVLTSYTDSASISSRALHLFWTLANQTAHNDAATGFLYPKNYGAAGTGLPQQMYVEMKVALPVASLNLVNSGGHAIPLDLYTLQWNNVNNAWLSPDQIEINVFNNSSSIWQWVAGMGLWDYVNCGGICRQATPANQDGNVDFTQWTTIGELVTTNLAGTNTSLCMYINGVKQPCQTIDTTDHPTVALDRWNSINLIVGAYCFGAGACALNQVDAYVQYLQVWECAGYQSQSCNNGEITDAGGIKTYASKAFDWIKDAAFPSAHADVFDFPFTGAWVCPDGSVSGVHYSRCMPAEFLRHRDWMKVCVPERKDCTQSDAAYLGSDPATHKALRGEGICYSKQPWTCDPGGRWPH